MSVDIAQWDNLWACRLTSKKRGFAVTAIIQLQTTSFCLFDVPLIFANLLKGFLGPVKAKELVNELCI
jgi:hypothetical protein